MSVFVKTRRKPSGIIVPLNQVKRQAIVDALDKCSGDYCLAARLLGISRTTVYRMARRYNYRPDDDSSGAIDDRFATHNVPSSLNQPRSNLRGPIVRCFL
jgi:DNA invertase Pin-like site-specific DNA recombinase